MNLYFMRHAHAGQREEWTGPDAERPLTEKGRRAAGSAASGLARRSPPISRIITSPYTRAADTASIVATQLNAPVTLSDALAPGFDLAGLFTILTEAGWASDLLLVGHQPSMGEVLAGLIGLGDGMVDMKKASVARVILPDAPMTDDGPTALAGMGKMRWLRTWQELEAKARG